MFQCDLVQPLLLISGLDRITLEHSEWRQNSSILWITVDMRYMLRGKILIQLKRPNFRKEVVTEPKGFYFRV